MTDSGSTLPVSSNSFTMASCPFLEAYANGLHPSLETESGSTWPVPRSSSAIALCPFSAVYAIGVLGILKVQICFASLKKQFHNRFVSTLCSPQQGAFIEVTDVAVVDSIFNEQLLYDNFKAEIR